MRSFYPVEFIKFNIKNKMKNIAMSIKENLGFVFSIVAVIIHALATVFFVITAYERQQLTLENELSIIKNTSKSEISSLKNYIDFNINTLNYKISQEQTNADRIYQMQLQQNKDINSKLDTIDNRLDKIYTGETKR